MFREMRRRSQLLSSVDTDIVLSRCTNGVLACLGDDGFPYAVPLSYVFFDGRIYFHSAKSGHKIDAISNSSKVSFTVIDKDTVVSEEYTTYFRSVIAFGKARIVEDEERLLAFRALVEKYSGDQSDIDKQEKITDCQQSYIVGIDIEHLTGKEAVELVRAKK